MQHGDSRVFRTPLLPAVSLNFLRSGEKEKLAGISLATEQILLYSGLHL